MAFSLNLSRLFPRDACLASSVPDDASVGKLTPGYQFSVLQRVAEKQIARLSLKGHGLSSLADHPAKSANFSRESMSRQDKPSYDRESNSSAMSVGKHSSSAEHGETEDYNSKFASSKFESTLQDILNDFKDSERRQRKKASGRAPTRNRKDSQTAGLKSPRLSEKASLDAWKDSVISKEIDLGFDDSSNGLPIESGTENAVTTVRSRRFSSAFKSHIPIGRNGFDTSTQNGSVRSQRPARCRTSNPVSSSTPKQPESLLDASTQNGSVRSQRPARSRTSNPVPSSTPKQPGSLFSQKERIISRNFLERDETHESGDCFRAVSLTTRSQESGTQMSPQFIGTSRSHSISNKGVENMEGFSLKASSDSVVEDDYENGSRKSPSPWAPEQRAANLDVGDDVVDGSPLSTSGVGPNSMSLPRRSAFCSDERAFDSTTILDSNPEEDAGSLNDDEANILTTSCAITKNSLSSLPASCIQLNDETSAKSTLGAESDRVVDYSPVSQDRVKPQLVWNHPLSDLPFELQYSYSEQPNAPIVGYRKGSQFSPFGSITRGRPWTGSAPLKPSKKKLPEFDSFNPPPRGKKGIKYVQDPGPYPKGQGPQPAFSREQIMGEPLSQEEVVQLVQKCRFDRRQVNLGRDGLIHNMLDVIHAHWKRRRVCKIRCLGVPTVDMDNVCFHVEDKTGGKIIYRTGGVLYLFRGRNYNYRDRPKIPLMLWKPPTPIYPKLIEKTPGGLTEEQANQLRKMGQNVAPLCNLAKNGIYLNLVDDVRTAFKVDDLVRINCQGLNPSDYKKIGAKLKDLVPCVLLSFEKEHLLLWKGKDEIATSLDDINSRDTAVGAEANLNCLQEPTSLDGRCLDSRITNAETNFQVSETESSSSPSARSQAAGEGISCVIQESQAVSHVVNIQASLDPCCPVAEDTIPTTPDDVVVSKSSEQVKDAFFKEISDEVNRCPVEATGSANVLTGKENFDKVDIFPEHTASLESLQQKGMDSLEFRSTRDVEEGKALSDIELENKDQINACSVGLDALWQQAFESGIAIELDEAVLDMDSVLKKSNELAHVAPPGPVYTCSLVNKLKSKSKEKTADTGIQITFGRKGSLKKKKAEKRMAVFPDEQVPPREGIPVNELARLLAC